MWTPPCKTRNPEIGLASFTKLTQKWIAYLNVKCKITKLLEDNIGGNLANAEFGRGFLIQTEEMIHGRESGQAGFHRN